MLLAFLPAVLFIISATLSRKIDVSLSLAIGAVVYGIAAFGPEVVRVTASAFNGSMAYVLASLIFAMALGYLLKEQRSRIASGLSALGARAAAFAIPAAIGLLPMPGGAYISAVLWIRCMTRWGLEAIRRRFSITGCGTYGHLCGPSSKAS